MPILEKLKLAVNQVMSVIMKDNIAWIGNWPVDHKYGLLVLVGDNKRFTVFFKTNTEQLRHIEHIRQTYEYSSEEVLIERWTLNGKPVHQEDIFIN